MIKNRWAIQWLGLIALGILIWWGGPMLNVGGKVPLDLAANRLLALLLVVIVWLTYHLVALTRANQTDLNLMAELSVSHQDPAQAFINDVKNEEANELRYKFESALKVLKEAQNDEKFNQRYLYELPWYVIIGAPGSGKTTLLTNSGINFPAKEKLGQEAVQGIGGTRNCTWLLSDEAVFIDTAGRYTTQDSHSDIDAAAWKQFLELLKKYRPQRPINGVLLTLSLADMLTWSEEELSGYARKLRHRAMELYENLGITIPIYLILTKCDLVAGFNEFFEDLDLEKRSQIWGFTFPADPRSPLKTAPTYLEKLLGRLEKRRLARLQQERDLIRKGLIVDFPQQMGLVKPLLIRFVKDTFQSSRYEGRLLLRGVYFTSGTQQGTPIDRIMSRLAGAFGLAAHKLPAFSGHVKNYFISRLLSNVILPESELAGVDRTAIRWRNLRNWAIHGALLGLVTILVILWSTSYLRNKDALAQVNGLIDKYESMQSETLQYGSDPKHLLDRLNTIAAATKVFSAKPWWEGFGLYQGKKLEWEIQRIYQKLLLFDLMGLIKYRMESKLGHYIRFDQGRDPSRLYELLKSYLMLGMPEKMETSLVHRWAQMENPHLFAQDSKLQQQMEIHLDQLFQLPLDAVDLDRKLISQARRRLESYKPHQLIYANLKSRLLQDHSNDLYLKDILNPAGLSILSTRNGLPPPELRIPLWYTIEGYQAVFQEKGPALIEDTLEGDWVVPSLKNKKRINYEKIFVQLQSDYFEDYETQWRGLLDNLKVKGVDNINQAIHITDSLAGPDSPLKPLLQALYKNVAIVPNLHSAPSGPEPFPTDWYGVANVQAANMGRTPLSPVRELGEHFKKITALVQPDDNQPLPIDKVLLQLAKLRDAILAGQTEHTAEIIRQSKREFSRLPEPIDSWLMPLADSIFN